MIRFSRAKLVVAIVAAITILWIVTGIALAQDNPPPDYRQIGGISSRVAIWIVAEVHLMFAAFVLGVPMFALVVEIIGSRTKDARYDRLAHEFTRLLQVAFSTTATFGAVLVFLLFLLYPKFTNYLADIFAPTLIIYPLLFFGEGFSLYLYYYGWDRLQGDLKWLHITCGVLLNLFGTALMFVANAWLTFAISPAGIDPNTGQLSERYGGLWAAINNPTWMPINVHRLIANVAFGGAIVGLYAAIRFLNAKSDEERAHYDWMGYVGSFIALVGLIPLPFAGYWLGREIYGFNQQVGITMMGGFLSWLWIIQALLIGTVFLSANYYLWLGLGRIEGGQRYQKYVKYLAAVLAVCFLIWATPHSLVASLAEARRIGSTFHPLLGIFGVMSAKNTVVNIMILTTFVGFTLYRRAGKQTTAGWKRTGQIAQTVLILAAAATVIFFGVYGYFVPANVRIGFSVYQVSAVLAVLFGATLIDVFLFRRATSLGPMRWGQMPPRSQYVLILLAVAFTWLMGLMGYARNAIRQHWHVYQILRDTSPDAFSPTLGFAARVISICVLLFLALIAFIFWLSELGEKKAPAEKSEMPKMGAPMPMAGAVGGGGGSPAPLGPDG
ncbi:MAG: cytochrome ubiquinol oxidase subunit I [Chloroflexi bacterium]|nr:cytochrome ubiquinol oxidase subunit I [Chloroflexota bacterium]